MITIRHTYEDGTLIEGSRRGDGVWEVVKPIRGWRYMPSIRQIGIQQSRDRAAKQWLIDAAAEALRAAGYEVAVEIAESDSRSFAEAEAERYDRAEERADRMASRADRAAASSNAAHDRAHQIADGIPFGQPILVGHHSERRHRRDLDRIHNLHGRGFEEGRKADHYAQRADAAENFQRYRENLPTTLRRIDKLERELRGVQRELDGEPSAINRAYAVEIKPASGAYRQRMEGRKAEITEELGYWRGHVAEMEAKGTKVWSRADFTKGDFAQWERRTWYEVLRVNAKSVTIPALIAGATVPVLRKADTHLTWTDTLPYDKITGRKSAEEIAQMEAAA